MTKMSRLGGIALVTLACALLASCVAQQADVVRIKKDLDSRISKLDESKMALEQAVSNANHALGEANSIIATQRAEINELLAARAEVMDQVSTIKDGDLFEVRGAIDQSEHHLRSVSEQMTQLSKEVTRSREEASVREKNLQPVIEQLRQQLNQQNDVVTSQSNKLSEFQESFVDFREALDTMRRALSEQEARWAEVTAQLKEVSTTQVGNSDVAQGNWEEMKQSVDSVVSAFEQVSQTLADRLDDQEQRLSQVVSATPALGSSQVVNGVEPHASSQSHSVEQLQKSYANLAPSQDSGPIAKSSNVFAGKGALLQHQMAQGSLEKLDRSKIVAHQNASSFSQRSPQRGKPTDQELTYYRQNYQKLLSGDFRGAFQGFRQFLKQHPRSALASNAQYWLGECFYGQRQYAQAIHEFKRVLTYYPASQKVPAALLKIGYSHLGLQDTKTARLMFRQLVRSHPKSPAAAKAYARLTEVDLGRKEAS